MQMTLQSPIRWVAVALVVAFAFGSALAIGLEVSVRWTIYLLLIPFVFAALFVIRQPAILVAAVFVPLMILERSLISFRQVGPFAIGVSFVTAAVVVAALWYHGHRPLPFGRYRWIWTGLVVVAALAVLQGRNTEVEIVRFQHHYLEGLLYFFLALLAWKTPNDIRQFCWILVGIGVFFALLQFYFLRTGVALLQPTFEVASSEREWRYGGPLGNPNSFADFCAMLIATMVPLTQLERSTVKRAVLLMSLATLVTALLLTGSRGGMLAATVGASVAIFIVTRHILRGWIAFPLALLLFAIGYQVAGSQFGETLDKSVERLDRGLEDVRTEIWSATVDIVVENPLGLGHDPLSFVGEVARKRPGFFFATPHNLFLGVAVTIGLAGLLFFLAFWIQVVADATHATKRAADPQTQRLAISISLILFVFLVAAMTEPIFDNGHKLNHLFWFVSGTVVWLRHNSAAHLPVR